jgi:hypothetical protein
MGGVGTCGSTICSGLGGGFGNLHPGIRRQLDAVTLPI